VSAERYTVQVTPVFTEVAGATVVIVGVVPYTTLTGEKRYLVSCVVEYGGWRSQPFVLDVASNEELERKLRVEVARMKVFIASGYTVPFQRVG